MTEENLISSVRNRLKNISRMKDFFDLYIFANQFQFDGKILVDAIRSTFRRRRTNLPERMPLALSDEFSGDNQKLVQWKAFLRKSGLQLNDDFRIIINYLRDFLFLPHLKLRNAIILASNLIIGGQFPAIPALELDSDPAEQLPHDD